MQNRLHTNIALHEVKVSVTFLISTYQGSDRKKYIYTCTMFKLINSLIHFQHPCNNYQIRGSFFQSD